uniref:Uncharacterized protein n=1 Tax=Panagrolaimus davidi TaxID=227884 RepID=A0A914QPG3_9BILA
MFSSSNHHQHYQQEEEPHLYGRYNRKINKEKQVKSATSNNDDSEYPEKRLETILKGLEARVQIGKDNLYKLHYQRSDLEFELKSLQDE